MIFRHEGYKNFVAKFSSGFVQNLVLVSQKE